MPLKDVGVEPSCTSYSVVWSSTRIHEGGIYEAIEDVGMDTDGSVADCYAGREDGLVVAKDIEMGYAERQSHRGACVASVGGKGGLAVTRLRGFLADLTD